MNKKLQDIIHKITIIKEKIDSYQPFDESLHNAIQEKLKIEWTYNSNALEGNTLTLGETAFFLREGLTSEGKPLKDFLEAKNHAEAIDFLNELVQEKTLLTEHFIKSFHQLLLTGIEYTIAKGSDGKTIHKPLTPGKYKTLPNHVLTISGNIHHYTEPEQVQIEIEKLLTWYTSRESLKLSSIEKSAIFHYRFVCIHPFDDGNGRLARLLMNLILMQGGFPPCIIRNEKRRQYLMHLEKIDKTQDYEPFIIFVAEELLITLNIIFNSITKKEFITPLSESLNKNQRQKIILESIQNEPISIGQLQTLLPQIKRPTLKKDLQAFIFSQKIKKKGVGKGVVYFKSS